jgi:hypothetical protein
MNAAQKRGNIQEMKYIIDDNYSIPDYLFKMPHDQLEKEIREYENMCKTKSSKTQNTKSSLIQQSPPAA